MSDELTPFKIVGQLVGTRKDDDGEIVGEELMGEIAIYAPNFGRVQELIDEAVEKAKARAAAQSDVPPSN